MSTKNNKAVNPETEIMEAVAPEAEVPAVETKTDKLEKVAAIEERLETELKEIEQKSEKDEEPTVTEQPDTSADETKKKKKRSFGKKKTEAKTSDTQAKTSEEVEVVIGEDSAKAVRKSTAKKATPTPATAKKSTSHILTIDDERAVVTERDKYRESRFDILESIQSRKVLTDTVRGIEKVNGETVAVVFHGDIKVIIPKSLFLPSETQASRLQETPDKVNGTMKNHLGAVIDYYAVGIDKENNIAIGNRLMAMENKRKYYYNAYDKSGNKIMYDGVICEARVISLTRVGMFVEVFGVETYIPKEEASYQRINSMDEKFYVGQTVNVKVLKIKSDSKNNTYRLTASVKQATVNPQIQAAKKYTVDNYYFGKVKMVGPYGVFVSLEPDVECMCKYSDYISRPAVDSAVTVKIDKIEPDTGRIYGYIVYAKDR